MSKQPNEEQLRSLQRFAHANGRIWKGQLRQLWMDGRYDLASLGGADSAHLQQLRNELGPSWLATYKLRLWPLL